VPLSVAHFLCVTGSGALPFVDLKLTNPLSYY
jgi:hypothetical protein